MAVALSLSLSLSLSLFRIRTPRKMDLGVPPFRSQPKRGTNPTRGHTCAVPRLWLSAGQVETPEASRRPETQKIGATAGFLEKEVAYFLGVSLGSP